ncbi:hypothetical protein pqer_cds_457 [Pandoravirus quercus]|uniref:F-box incomplete domain containing protein n=1 Tax=Pandoravirus quercus TaxID=2107709 RepID=A0A2U7U8X5_9VIRU|nr:hypothetical protein pqer_cds_457 [Pandoravirus quercus]AVK74879.1 hypothetical protein pqer_cds_457 [Pandoravirus quercus]
MQDANLPCAVDLHGDAPKGACMRLPPVMTADDLPLDALALILGEALEPRWHFCARATCRLWASVCASLCPRSKTVRVSCVASLLARAADDDPLVGTPEAAEAWCLAMGATLTEAGAALVGSGREHLVAYAISRPRAHDVPLAAMIPFEALTVAVVRLCEPDDVASYLDRHLLAVIPDEAVDTPLDADGRPDNDDDHSRREEVLEMLEQRYALRFESVRARWQPRGFERGYGHGVRTIAAYMGHDPKLARNVLADWRHSNGPMTAEGALFLLWRTGQMENTHWPRRFEAQIADALGGTPLDPRAVIDLAVRSVTAARIVTFETPLFEWLYTESALLAPLRPIRTLDTDNCPLLDPSACVDMRVSVALLRFITSDKGLPASADAIDALVRRVVDEAHRRLCNSDGTDDDDDDRISHNEIFSTLFRLALCVRKAHNTVGAQPACAPRRYALPCAAGEACAVLAEARRRIAESDFISNAWRALFDLDPTL